MSAVHTIKLRRGAEADMPTLESGEPAWTTDTNKLYIGSGTSNVAVGGNSFSTITPSSGASVVADSISDTLTLTGSGGITITGTAATDTIVIDGSSIVGWSDEQSQDAIGTILVDSSEIDFTYNDATPSITALLINTTVTAASYGSATQVGSFTVDAKGRLTAASNTAIAIPSTAVTDFTEAAQDAVGGILTDSASIDFTYNDGANTISATVIQSGLDHGSIGGLTDDDHTQYLKLVPADATRNVVQSSGDWTAITLKNNASQVTNPFEFQTSGGVDLIVFTKDGEIRFGDGTSGCSNSGFNGQLAFFGDSHLNFTSTTGSARFGCKLIPTSDATFDLGAVGGLGNRWNNVFLSGTVKISTNNQKYMCGGSSQASFYYDGTDAIINPKESGTGVLKILGDISLIDEDMIFGTTTGTKLATSTSQKLSLWNATPIVQPTTAIAAATFVANTSAIADDTATFDGYTIGQVVKALRNIGALA